MSIRGSGPEAVGALKFSITFSAPCTKCTILCSLVFLFMANRLQSKSWIGTSYRIEEFAFPEGIAYGVYQKEKCPTTGRVHVQFFCQMTKRTRLSAMKKLFPGDHLEIARSPVEARAYCMKEETRVSSPVEVGKWKEEKSVDMVSAVKRARVCDILEEQPQLWRSARALMELRQLYSSPRREMTRGYLFVGKTGCGKTRTANLIAEFVGDSYWQDCSQWWNGYDGQDVVIVDEFRGQYEPSFLLKLLDRYPMKVPFKGGYSNFSSKCVIFTSNLDLALMYDKIDSRTVDAFKRRIKVINF